MVLGKWRVKPPLTSAVFSHFQVLVAVRKTSPCCQMFRIFKRWTSIEDFTSFTNEETSEMLKSLQRQIQGQAPWCSSNVFLRRSRISHGDHVLNPWPSLKYTRHVCECPRSNGLEKGDWGVTRPVDGAFSFSCACTLPWIKGENVFLKKANPKNGHICRLRILTWMCKWGKTFYY